MIINFRNFNYLFIGVVLTIWHCLRGVNLLWANLTRCYLFDKSDFWRIPCNVRAVNICLILQINIAYKKLRLMILKSNRSPNWCLTIFKGIVYNSYSFRFLSTDVQRATTQCHRTVFFINQLEGVFSNRDVIKARDFNRSSILRISNLFESIGLYYRLSIRLSFCKLRRWFSLWACCRSKLYSWINL